MDALRLKLLHVPGVTVNDPVPRRDAGWPARWPESAFDPWRCGDVSLMVVERLQFLRQQIMKDSSVFANRHVRHSILLVTFQLRNDYSIGWLGSNL